MRKRRSNHHRDRFRASLTLILSILIITTLLPNSLQLAQAQPSSTVGTIKPTTYPLLFGSSGNIEIDIPKPGIAVRIEIPREFLQIGGVSVPENDTSFVTSNIRNDYFYYNLVDESKHWTYNWQDNASDGPCFKPHFSYYDPNAPYCLEIWNYLSSPLNYSAKAPSPLLKQPDETIYCYTPGPESYYDLAPACPPDYFNHAIFPNHVFDYTDLVGVDYCQPPNLDKFVFQCFSASPAAPKFVLLHGLSSPGLAGVYNFTLSVANRTNILGYPDFVHAWRTTLSVPVSMAYNAGSISGYVCDAGSGPPTCIGPPLGRIRGKGVVYAMQCPSMNPCSLTTATIVARAYLDQSLCQTPFTQCGQFDLTGLAPGNYLVEGSAGVDRGVAYSLTPYGGYSTPATVAVLANTVTSIQLPLRRSPLACGSIAYYTNALAPFQPTISNEPLLFGSNPDFGLNITVEGTDSLGHTFRYFGYGSPGGAFMGTFNLTTGVGVKYVGTDPYGTEFAGLPAPEDIGPSGYTLNVNVYVTGFVQRTTASVTFTQSPGTTMPTCSTQPSVSPNPVSLVAGGVIIVNLQFCNTFQGCTLESPDAAERSLPLGTVTDALFGGNLLLEAYDSTGLLRGVAVIDGTLANGKTSYANSSQLSLYIVGFSEYYNHTLSGVWHTFSPDFGHDYGLPDGQYSLDIFVRGYELTSTSPSVISIVGGSSAPVIATMTRGGAFQVTVGSYDNRPNSTAIQARLPWRFLDSSIPVAARVYFYGSTGTVGYVDLVMALNLTNGVGVYTFTVVFAGQNWSLREIWFYGLIPTVITNDTYTIEAYTLGYVPQTGGGVSLPNNLVGFAQTAIVLFVGNEADITTPLYSSPQSFTTTQEYDQAIGQAYSSGLAGAETANLTSGTPTLQFNIYGFGGMQLSPILQINSTYQITLCETDEFLGLGNLGGTHNICGQGHFFYVDPTGTQHFDFGMGIGNYTEQVPEFGFNSHFLQVAAPPTVSFGDLFLQAGVVFSMIQMAVITQNTLVSGFCGGICSTNRPSNVAPLSWAQVEAVNSTYSRTISTSDGSYAGVGALFVPAGTYNVTFSDVQYTSQTFMNQQVGWGSSSSLTPPSPLCPIGSTCP